MELALSSPAKINLFLHIIGRRSDGYHLLQTAYQFINFYDDMFFSSRTDSTISLQSSSQEILPEENLIFKAAKLLQAHSSCQSGINIRLTKRIPLGGGLGGGSSNAATTLLALNKLWEINLNKEELAQLGLTLGADIPIFIHGRAAFAEGIGEKFYPIDPPEDWFLVIFPNCKVSTEKIFSDSQLTRNTPEITIAEFFENGGHNDCEPVARKHFPEIANTLDWLNQYTTARMTGTGSSVFATFKSKEAALKVAEKIPASLNSIIVRGTNHSLLHMAMKI